MSDSPAIQVANIQRPSSGGGLQADLKAGGRPGDGDERRRGGLSPRTTLSDAGPALGASRHRDGLTFTGGSQPALMSPSGRSRRMTLAPQANPLAWDCERATARLRIGPRLLAGADVVSAHSIDTIAHSASHPVSSRYLRPL